MKCDRCGSYAINPGKHGRDKKSDLDLCDVCYWRKRAEEAEARAERLLLRIRDAVGAVNLPDRSNVKEEREKPGATHKLPLGAVVIYRDGDRRAKLIVVQHSRDCDESPLYMVGERPIIPPGDKLYSMAYLVYRLHAGWFVGNVPLSLLRDTGERVTIDNWQQ